VFRHQRGLGSACHVIYASISLPTIATVSYRRWGCP